jgi:hypothetical protein
MNRKQKRDEKNERHRNNEIRRRIKYAMKHWPKVCEMLGASFVAYTVRR